MLEAQLLRRDTAVKIKNAEGIIMVRFELMLISEVTQRWTRTGKKMNISPSVYAICQSEEKSIAQSRSQSSRM